MIEDWYDTEQVVIAQGQRAKKYKDSPDGVDDIQGLRPSMKAEAHKMMKEAKDRRIRLWIFTGGEAGGDTIFGEEAEEMGHKVIWNPAIVDVKGGQDAQGEWLPDRDFGPDVNTHILPRGKWTSTRILDAEFLENMPPAETLTRNIPQATKNYIQKIQKQSKYFPNKQKELNNWGIISTFLRDNKEEILRRSKTSNPMSTGDLPSDAYTIPMDLMYRNIKNINQATKQHQKLAAASGKKTLPIIGVTLHNEPQERRIKGGTSGNEARLLQLNIPVYELMKHTKHQPFKFDGSDTDSSYNSIWDPPTTQKAEDYSSTTGKPVVVVPPSRDVTETKQDREAALDKLHTEELEEFEFGDSLKDMIAAWEGKKGTFVSEKTKPIIEERLAAAEAKAGPTDIEKRNKARKEFAASLPNEIFLPADSTKTGSYLFPTSLDQRKDFDKPIGIKLNQKDKEMIARKAITLESDIDATGIETGRLIGILKEMRKPVSDLDDTTVIEDEKAGTDAESSGIKIDVTPEYVGAGEGLNLDTFTLTGDDPEAIATAEGLKTEFGIKPKSGKRVKQAIQASALKEYIKSQRQLPGDQSVASDQEAIRERDYVSTANLKHWWNPKTGYTVPTHERTSRKGESGALPSAQSDYDTFTNKMWENPDDGKVYPLVVALEHKFGGTPLPEDGGVSRMLTVTKDVKQTMAGKEPTLEDISSLMQSGTTTTPVDVGEVRGTLYWEEKDKYAKIGHEFQDKNLAEMFERRNKKLIREGKKPLLFTSQIEDMVTASGAIDTKPPRTTTSVADLQQIEVGGKQKRAAKNLLRELKKIERKKQTTQEFSSSEKIYSQIPESQRKQFEADLGEITLGNKPPNFHAKYQAILTHGGNKLYEFNKEELSGTKYFDVKNGKFVIQEGAEGPGVKKVKNFTYVLDIQEKESFLINPKYDMGTKPSIEIVAQSIASRGKKYSLGLPKLDFNKMSWKQKDQYVKEYQDALKKEREDNLKDIPLKGFEDIEVHLGFDEYGHDRGMGKYVSISPEEKEEIIELSQTELSGKKVTFEKAKKKRQESWEKQFAEKQFVSRDVTKKKPIEDLEADITDRGFELVDEVDYSKLSPEQQQLHDEKISIADETQQYAEAFKDRPHVEDKAEIFDISTSSDPRDLMSQLDVTKGTGKDGDFKVEMVGLGLYAGLPKGVLSHVEGIAPAYLDPQLQDPSAFVYKDLADELSHRKRMSYSAGREDKMIPLDHLKRDAFGTSTLRDRTTGYSDLKRKLTKQEKYSGHSTKIKREHRTPEEIMSDAEKERGFLYRVNPLDPKDARKISVSHERKGDLSDYESIKAGGYDSRWEELGLKKAPGHYHIDPRVSIGDRRLPAYQNLETGFTTEERAAYRLKLTPEEQKVQDEIFAKMIRERGGNQSLDEFTNGNGQRKTQTLIDESRRLDVLEKQQGQNGAWRRKAASELPFVDVGSRRVDLKEDVINFEDKQAKERANLREKQMRDMYALKDKTGISFDEWTEYLNKKKQERVVPENISGRNLSKEAEDIATNIASQNVGAETTRYHQILQQGIKPRDTWIPTVTKAKLVDEPEISSEDGTRHKDPDGVDFKIGASQKGDISKVVDLSINESRILQLQPNMEFDLNGAKITTSAQTMYTGKPSSTVHIRNKETGKTEFKDIFYIKDNPRAFSGGNYEFISSSNVGGQGKPATHAAEHVQDNASQTRENRTTSMKDLEAKPTYSNSSNIYTKSMANGQFERKQDESREAWKKRLEQEAQDYAFASITAPSVAKKAQEDALKRTMSKGGRIKAALSARRQTITGESGQKGRGVMAGMSAIMQQRHQQQMQKRQLDALTGRGRGRRDTVMDAITMAQSLTQPQQGQGMFGMGGMSRGQGERDTLAMMGSGQSRLTDMGGLSQTKGSSLTDFGERIQRSGGSPLTDYSTRIGGTAGHLGGALAHQMSGAEGTRGIFTSGKEFLESRGQPTSLRIMGQREKDIMSFSLGGTLGLGASMRPERGLGSPSGFLAGELISQKQTQNRAPNGRNNGAGFRGRNNR